MSRLALMIGLLLALVGGVVWAQEPVDTDTRLTAQLREAFRQVEGLESVTLEVRGGVVVLRGRVSSLESSYKAEELASKLPGVLTVANGLTVEAEVASRLSPTLSKLQRRFDSLISFSPLLLVAALIVALFWVASRALGAWTWLYQRVTSNVFLQEMYSQFVSLFVLLCGILLALELLEATAIVGAVLGTAGIVGVAVGFAFRDFAENTLASIMLSLRQPFSPKDFVSIDGHEGTVVRLTSRATILLTIDGNHLRIPNAQVYKALIVNFTRNPERRFDFTVGVGTTEDLLATQELIVETLRDSPGILDDPPPICLIQSLGDWSVNIVVLGWVDQTKFSYLKVRGESIRLVKEALDAAGVALPEPIYNIRQGQTVDQAPTTARAPVDVSELAPETHLDNRADEERETEEADFLEPEAQLE